MSYEKDVIIDHSALDVEWLEQPRLMFKYTSLQASLQQQYSQEEENMAVIKAELDKAIRMDPESYEIVKITETVVSNTIISQADYQNQLARLNEILFELNIAKAAVKAIDCKKSALENLVRLHGQNYFAGPSVPRDLSKEWEAKETQKQANRKVRITRTK